MEKTTRIEYRVRLVPRYYVTRYHASEDENGGNSAGCSAKGVYDDPDTAYEVAYALCKAEHDRLGWATDDQRIVYPETYPMQKRVAEDSLWGKPPGLPPRLDQSQKIKA